MTILCALFDQRENCFWLGCNGSALVGQTRLPEKRSKWLRLADWAIAFTGSGIADMAIISERPKFPSHSEDVQQIISFLLTTFEKYNIGEKEEGHQDFNLSGLLVHKSGLLFDVDSRLSVSAIPQGTLWARGSGMDFALGADEVAKKWGISAEERIEFAVQAAIDLDAECPGDVMIENF